MSKGAGQGVWTEGLDWDGRAPDHSGD